MIDRFHYDEIFLAAPDEEEEESPDVDDGPEPEEPYYIPDRRPLNHSPVDYIYDPLSRKGWE